MIDLSVASNLALSGMIISLLSQINPDLPVFFLLLFLVLLDHYLVYLMAF